MVSVKTTQRWRDTYPNAMIGLLEISGANNSLAAPALEKEKHRIEAEIRGMYGEYERSDFRALPVIAAYIEYYKRFKKTYHVLQQVESIAHKGRGLPKVSPLVDANFAAEVKTLMLTASHDLDKLNGEIVIDIASEDEEMVQMNGKSKALHPGDMVMRAGGKIVCSIIYGQDNHSFITPKTTHVLYVTYVPAGIPIKIVHDHSNAIKKHVKLISKNIVIELQETLVATE